MYKTIKLVSVMSLMALASACAVTPNNHINMSARQHIDEVDAYLIVTQDEIYAGINQSNTTAAAGGGLLFAFIDAAVDNSRTKKAEELMKPIRNSLIDFDFAVLLQANIEEKLNGIQWMSINNVELERSIGDGHIMKKIEKCEVSAILVMTADYRLAPNFDGVITSVSSIMFPNKEALYAFKEKLDNNENPVDQADNIYRNDIVVNIPLELIGKQEENAQYLANSNGDEIKRALEASAKKIAHGMLVDIQLDDVES